MAGMRSLGTSANGRKIVIARFMKQRELHYLEIAGVNDRDALDIYRSGEQLEEKVRIFVCGAQKGGATSLFSYFCEHRGLRSPDRKDLHFFDNEDLDWSNPDYDRMHSHFADPAGSRLRYDVTPIYSFWPNALERIATYNPYAKLIFLFRDPYERAVSNWAMEYDRGTESLDFSQAIREGRTRLDCLPQNARPRRYFSYVERGHYGQQVEKALKLFPRNQLLFLRSEDLRDEPSATLENISHFLDIMAFPNCAPKTEHARYATNGAIGPRPDDLAYIAEIVATDLERFKNLTGLDIANWLTTRFLGQHDAQ